jgi:uncharacterized protein YdeI (YjbR/CyaY-like superfamily)
MGELAGDRFVEVEVTSEAELHKWLSTHHDQQDAVWLITYKKAAPNKYITHEQVLDQLIAYGWTDGIRRRIGDERSMQLISPRRTQPWAKSYKDRAERLIATNKMQVSGMESVEKAKATGMWDAMNDVDALLMPEDLAAALAQHEPAAHHFASFPVSTQRNILRWIASAKTEATRAKRIARTAVEAQQNIRVKSNG